MTQAYAVLDRKCGCSVDWDGVTILYCPMHTAAWDLLTLAKHARRQDLAPDVLQKRALKLLTTIGATP